MTEEKKERKKPGRPKKEVTRQRTTGIRFDKGEYYVIKNKAQQAGLTLTAYIRQSAIEGKIRPRLSEEERHFIRQLIGLANNMNQIAKACHEEGVLRAMRYFEHYKNQLDDLLQKLKS